MTITVYGDTNGTALSATYSQPSGGGISPGNVSPGNGNGTPGSGNGPGGIGNGDGGFNTPSNNLFGIPVITFPNSGDNTGIEESDTVTSSVFDDGGTGATHTASRWMIMLLGEDGDTPNSNSPIYIYDSGVDTGNLTTLPLTVVELQHDTQYAVRVRYKADDGTWSRWSFDQPFTSYSCPVPSTLQMNVDFSTTAGYNLTGSNISQVKDLGQLADAYAYTAGTEATIDSDLTTYHNDRALFTAAGCNYQAGVTTDYSAEQTVFMVVMPKTPDVDSFLGQSGDLDIFGYALGTINFWGIKLSPTNTGSVVISSTASGGSPGYETAANTLTADKLSIVEIVMQLSGDGDSLIVVDGVEVYSAPEDWGVTTGASIGAAVNGVNASDIGEIAELRVYNVLLTAGQREAIRVQLAAKWGVTFVNTTGPSI